MYQNIGKTLIFVGILIAVVGITIYLFGKNFSWFANLPGDIKMEGENFRLFIPITSMIVLSLLLNLILYIIKLFK
ncbi:MAG: DUF2905 domain-containing protein [Halanaerobiales bacterium]